jgi:hypothetical protein
MSDYTKPLPRGEDISGEFYQFCQQHELRFQRCQDCGTWRHMPRESCAACGSFNWSWERSRCPFHKSTASACGLASFPRKRESRRRAPWGLDARLRGHDVLLAPDLRNRHLGDFRERFSTRLHTCSPASHPVLWGCDLPPLGGGQESVHTAVDHNEGGSF